MDRAHIKCGKKVADSISTAKNFRASSTSVSTLATKFSPLYVSSAYSSSSSVSSFSSSCPSISEFRSKFNRYEEDYHNAMPSYLTTGSKKTKTLGKKEPRSEDINRKEYRALHSYKDKDTKMQKEDEIHTKEEGKEKNPWCRMIWDKLMKKDKESKNEQKKKSYNPTKPISTFASSGTGRVTCNRDLVEDGSKLFQVVWRCSTCTSLNHSSLPTCEECGMIRAPERSEWMKRGIKYDKHS
ncbi:uncharacterized protein LOC117167449 [Belonocnema kinseyi]|uniref:uncharacterized protein LOC117167449 n=1 Tax=Belonocnema kinseyi TaxID=2817044 RepID=UPI00143E0C89|nr:uncharacterized protein LOC117167449 [Belonocnema kinseyi]